MNLRSEEKMYEVLDLESRTFIYSGHSKEEMVNILFKHVKDHENGEQLTEEDVRTLNHFMLKKVGISIYIS